MADFNICVYYIDLGTAIAARIDNFTFLCIIVLNSNVDRKKQIGIEKMLLFKCNRYVTIIIMFLIREIYQVNRDIIRKKCPKRR